MGGENTAVTTTSSFKSVEHVQVCVVEVTAKRLLFLVTSVTPISTLKMNGTVWTAARHRAVCRPYTVRSTWENPNQLLAASFTCTRRWNNKNEETKKPKK